jgi:selenocysteine lyase/cysteine desulfurase
VQIEGHEAQPVCEALAARGIGTGYGNFYAYRLMEALGIDPNTGVLRCSLVHYNTPGDVDALVGTLGELLGA